MTPEELEAIQSTRHDARKELERLIPNYFSDRDVPPEMAIERALRDIDALLDEVGRCAHRRITASFDKATDRQVFICNDCGTEVCCDRFATGKAPGAE